jgi:sulfur-oxidizing protein SoxX
MPSTTAAATAAEGLVAYVVSGNAITNPLTGQPGDSERGRQLVVGRTKGNCLACHMLPIPEEDDHGRIGPPLLGVANRMSEAELRLRVINPKLINPATVMPAFYRVEGLHRVAKQFAGTPILTAQEVEDVVAYLTTLKCMFVREER